MSREDKQPILNESGDSNNMGSSSNAPPPYTENDDNKFGVPPPAYGAHTVVGPPTIQTTRQIVVATPALMGLNRVICGHCNQPFMFAIALNVPVRCPICRKTSVIAAEWSKKRALIFFILGIIFLLIGVGITAGTYAYAQENGGYYFINFGSIIVGIVYLGLAWYYKNMKISQVEPAMIRTA